MTNTLEHCWAALDIGTNTTMTLVAVAGSQGLREHTEFCLTTRLGEGIHAARELRPGAQQRTLEAVSSHLCQMREVSRHGAGIAVATSAVRGAVNGPAFLQRCGGILGAPPLLLTGEEEARFTFRGVASDQAPGRLVLLVDIGGGSTEISVGVIGEGCQSAESVDLGCVRIGERHGLLDRASAGDIAQARAAVAAVLEPLRDRFRGRTDLSAVTVIASGGTASTFAAMHQALPAYDKSRVHGYCASVEAVDHAFREISVLSADERSRLPCVSVGRAPVLPAGLLILLTFLRLVGAARVTVSVRGLRFGLVDALACGDLAASWTW